MNDPAVRRRFIKTAAVVLTVGAIIAIGATFWRRDAPQESAVSAPPARQQASTSEPASAVVAKPAANTSAPPAGSESAAMSAQRDVHPFDIATAALGGRIESVTSERDTAQWSAANLIEGGLGDVTCSPLCAWASEDDSLPQEIVLSFYQQREALVRRVTIDTLTGITREQTAGVPHEVELWGSMSSATDGFARIVAVKLPAQAMRHVVDFEPVRIRYLTVRVLSRHAGRQTLIGEIGVFEAKDAPSILVGRPHNLIMPALGGAIVSFTSEYGPFRAAHLVDGDPTTEWRSSDDTQPQEFVFAFHEDRVALIDRVVLTVADRLTEAPRAVSIAVSTDSPTEGFEEAGRFTLERRSGEQAFQLGRRARFLKLRILENFGGPRILAALAEIAVLEGAEPGYESALFRTTEPANVTDAAQRTASAGNGTREQEPNDTAPQASGLALGGTVLGALDPTGETDYFRVSVPGAERSVLTVDLSAEPYIRTSLDLVDTAGTAIKRFDPSLAPAAHVTFSWLVPPGGYLLRLTEPPASVVLVWDTSGSMKGREHDLRRAIETYLDDLPPQQHVNLVRFSDNIETLLPEFSNDRLRLKTSTEGKFYAAGSTPLYDAIAKAISLLDGRGGNRAIVVMTDGEDAGSDLTRPEFWALLEAKKIRVYTVGLGDMERHSPKLGSSPRRLMEYIAMATGGRAFFTTDAKSLVIFYRQIAEELGRVCRYRLGLTQSRAFGTLHVRSPREQNAVALSARIELILDASGSMKRRIDGRTMIEAAKAVLSDIVEGLPEDAKVALRVYGHRIPEGRRGACEDSQLVFPFASVDKRRLTARIKGIRALGTTPIAYSLQQVARDMGKVPGEKMVVLVTDGKEECGGDPAAAVQSLRSAGINLRLNIVGFGLADQRLKAELTELAALTSGQFVDARDAGSLRTAIQRSLALPYDVLDGSGTRIAGGATGDTVKIPEGIYTVALRSGDKPQQIASVPIRAGEATVIELRKEGREIGFGIAAKRGSE